LYNMDEVREPFDNKYENPKKEAMSSRIPPSFANLEWQLSCSEMEEIAIFALHSMRSGVSIARMNIRTYQNISSN